MSNIKLDDTIAAVSTPIGEGGIGIVRLSGKDSLRIVDKIFLPRNGERSSLFKTYTVHYGHIIEKSESKEQRAKSKGQRAKSKGQRVGRLTHKVIDEVILTVMRSPKSYTKEDVVEINCHSGIVPLRKILDLSIRNGARLAQPGEFTKRAFLNGRIDIAQAEAVLDIIRAKTELSLKAAEERLEGLFSKKINSIRDGLISILAHIEAVIDFPEEGDVRILKRDILGRLKAVKDNIEVLIETADSGKVLRNGIHTVICGRANVGKSSLMNALLKESRSIVTHIPGTTRDTIEEVVNIKGIPIVLADTAGISSTDHPIEKEGVKRSYLFIRKADLILLVLDYARRLNRDDLELMQHLKGKDNMIIVINKNDLKKRIDINTVRKLLPKRPIIYVSAINLSGISELENKIQRTIFAGMAPTADFSSVSNDRQLEILHRALGEVREAIGALGEKASLDCVSIYVRSAIECMGEITGHTITEEALDKIFSEFCIGK